MPDPGGPTGLGLPVVVPGLPQNIRILPAEHLLKRGVWGVEGAGRDPQFLAKKSKFVRTSAEPRGGMDTRYVAHVVFCCPPPASWLTPADTTKLRHTSTAVRGRHIKQIFMAHRGSKMVVVHMPPGHLPPPFLWHLPPLFLWHLPPPIFVHLPPGQLPPLKFYFNFLFV